MSSMSKSNNFLLRNGQYNKDNVFDHFDINNLVSNDLKIPKTSLNNFLYYNEMKQMSKGGCQDTLSQIYRKTEVHKAPLLFLLV